MTKKKVYKGTCQKCGLEKMEKMTLFRGQKICGDCLNPPDEPLLVTDFLGQPEDANLAENYGEKFRYGDLIEVQVRVGQRRRYYASQHRKRPAH